MRSFGWESDPHFSNRTLSHAHPPPQFRGTSAYFIGKHNNLLLPPLSQSSAPHPSHPPATITGDKLPSAMFNCDISPLNERTHTFKSGGASLGLYKMLTQGKERPENSESPTTRTKLFKTQNVQPFSRG